MTVTDSKQMQAEIVLANLPEGERRAAALAFNRILKRGMTPDEVLGIKQYSDMAGWTFSVGARKLAEHKQQEQAAEMLEQKGLL